MPAVKPTKPDDVAPKVRLGRGRRPLQRRLRDAKDALYRQHIQEVAETLFARQGFAATKMQTIAARAGVSLATLYQAYANKKALHRSILIERDRQMLAVVEAHSGPGAATPQSVEQVLMFMSMHLQFLLNHADYLRLQLQEGYAWYHNAARPTCDEQLMWEQGLRQMMRVLAWGMQRKFFSPGDPADLTRLVLVHQQTRLANWVMAGMREPHASVIARIQADFVRMFCVPKQIARLLSPDGAALNAKTLQKIRSLAAEHAPRPNAIQLRERPAV
jgi:AcrR family transcriptional regulator